MIQSSSDKWIEPPWQEKRDCHLEKWKRACNLNVIKAFAKAFNKGSFLVISIQHFNSAKPISQTNDQREQQYKYVLEDYSSPIILLIWNAMFYFHKLTLFPLQG